jgi:hypothetical protein
MPILIRSTSDSSLGKNGHRQDCALMKKAACAIAAHTGDKAQPCDFAPVTHCGLPTNDSHR